MSAIEDAKEELEQARKQARQQARQGVRWCPGLMEALDDLIEHAEGLEHRAQMDSERFVSMLYILARDHVPFGTLYDIARSHIRGTSGGAYSCEGSEAMARRVLQLMNESKGSES